MSGDPSSEISSLRSEIRSVRSEISGLRRQVSNVSGVSDRLRRIEETVPAALDDLARQQKATRDTLNSLRELYERDRIVADAYNKLAVAERQWQAKFGRYEEARDMAASIIDVVASGHINRAVILDVTERLAIKTPRYWVAQATLAVAAWLADDPQQHRAALDYALALDFEKTSLFMALLLRDQTHDEIRQEWLAAYLSRLTPVNLPQHFQVIIDAVMTGYALGDGAAPRLLKQVAEWYGEEGARQDILDTTIGEWKRRLLSLGTRYGDRRDFSRLAAAEQAWKVLASRYQAGRAIEQAARYFRERFETGACVSDDVRGNLVTLLKKLARTEDPEEEEIRSVIREQHAVTVAGDGRAARAMVVAEEEGRKRTLNIVGMVSQSAFAAPDGSQLPAPTVTELLAIWLSSSLIVQAADELRDDLPSVGLIEIPVGERPWVCRFACDDEAATTAPALRQQADQQARQICAQIQKDADQRQGRLRWLRKWGCPGGFAAALGLGGATFIPGAPPELMVPAIIVAVPSILGLSRLPAVVRRATDRIERQKRAVTDEISQAADELADLWEADRRTAGVHLPDLRRHLASLTADSVSAATRRVSTVPLPKTREFPSWTPRPPGRFPSIETGDDPPSLDD
jgi:hypothetical protein